MNAIVGMNEVSRAVAVSADGSSVVGYIGVPGNVFRWKDGQITYLQPPPSGGTGARWLGPTSVSGDGSVVVGSGYTTLGSEAFYWTEYLGTTSLHQMLIAEGVADVEGWQLSMAIDVSSDGRTIVGKGTNPQGEGQAWIVELCGSPLPEPGYNRYSRNKQLPLYDLSVERVEFIQAVYDPVNPPDLVAGKPIFVRAHIGRPVEDPPSHYRWDAVLRTFDGNGDIIATFASTELPKQTPYLTLSNPDEEDTINFWFKLGFNEFQNVAQIEVEVNPCWNCSRTAFMCLDEDPGYARIPEPDYTNNKMACSVSGNGSDVQLICEDGQNWTVKCRRPLKVGYVAVPYPADVGGTEILYPPGTTWHEGFPLTKALLPIPSQSTYTFLGDFPLIRSGLGLVQPPPSTPYFWVTWLFHAIRDLAKFRNDSYPDYDVLVGWVPDVFSLPGGAATWASWPWVGDGGVVIAPGGGTNVFAEEFYLAHEIHHCIVEAKHLAGSSGGGVDMRRAISPYMNLGEFQGLMIPRPGGIPDLGSFWVTAFERDQVLAASMLDCGQGATEAASAQEVVSVYALYWPGDGTVQLFRSMDVGIGEPGPYDPLSPIGIRAYTHGSGMILDQGVPLSQPFDASADAPMSISCAIPTSLAGGSEISRIEITEVATGNVLVSRDRSPNAPSVVISNPTKGAVLQDGMTVLWSGTDLDGDALVYDVAYSWNGGVDFIPLLFGSADESLVLDLGELPGSDPGAAILRVTATDGMNEATVNVLNLTGGALQAPSVLLVSPADGTTVPVGATVLADSTSFDPEDVQLLDENITWLSDLDGVVANGPAPMITSLSVGTHVLTVEAVDSDGMTATDAVTIEVTSRNDCDPPLSVSLEDFGYFASCARGPDVVVAPLCVCFDYDRNRRVDLLDFALFQRPYQTGQ